VGVSIRTSKRHVFSTFTWRFRLRVGEDHQGWVLRLIKAREATLPPREPPALGGPTVPPPIPNSIGTIPTLSSAKLR
jgi:hypothetical protein